MKMLNVRFSDTQTLKLNEYAGLLNMSVSDVARAALHAGLKEIAVNSAQSIDRGIEFTSLNAVKAK